MAPTQQPGLATPVWHPVRLVSVGIIPYSSCPAYSLSLIEPDRRCQVIRRHQPTALMTAGAPRVAPLSADTALSAPPPNAGADSEPPGTPSAMCDVTRRRFTNRAPVQGNTSHSPPRQARAKGPYRAYSVEIHTCQLV